MFSNGEDDDCGSFDADGALFIGTRAGSRPFLCWSQPISFIGLYKFFAKAAGEQDLNPHNYYFPLTHPTLLSQADLDLPFVDAMIVKNGKLVYKFQDASPRLEDDGIISRGALKAIVKGPYVVDPVNDLRVDSAPAAAQYVDVCCSTLKRGAQAFDGKGTHANDNDVL